jgi:hypothetical protein
MSEETAGSTENGELVNWQYMKETLECAARQLVGKTCWAVSAGGAAGFLMTLDFGIASGAKRFLAAPVDPKQWMSGR